MPSVPLQFRYRSISTPQPSSRHPVRVLLVAPKGPLLGFLLAVTLPLLLVLLGVTLTLPLADFLHVIDNYVGNHSDEIPLIYGGATFEIKTLS